MTLTQKIGQYGIANAHDDDKLIDLLKVLADVASAAEEYVQTDGGEMYDRLNIALARLHAVIGGSDD